MKAVDWFYPLAFVAVLVFMYIGLKYSLGGI